MEGIWLERQIPVPRVLVNVWALCQPWLIKAQDIPTSMLARCDAFMAWQEMPDAWREQGVGMAYRMETSGMPLC